MQKSLETEILNIISEYRRKLSPFTVYLLTLSLREKFPSVDIPHEYVRELVYKNYSSLPLNGYSLSTAKVQGKVMNVFYPNGTKPEDVVYVSAVGSKNGGGKDIGTGRMQTFVPNPSTATPATSYNTPSVTVPTTTPLTNTAVPLSNSAQINVFAGEVKSKSSFLIPASVLSVLGWQPKDTFYIAWSGNKATISRSVLKDAIVRQVDSKGYIRLTALKNTTKFKVFNRGGDLNVYFE